MTVWNPYQVLEEGPCLRFTKIWLDLQTAQKTGIGWDWQRGEIDRRAKQIDDITKLSIGVSNHDPRRAYVRAGITKRFKGVHLEGLINSTEATFLYPAGRFSEPWTANIDPLKPLTSPLVLSLQPLMKRKISLSPLLSLPHLSRWPFASSFPLSLFRQDGPLGRIQHSWKGARIESGEDAIHQGFC